MNNDTRKQLIKDIDYICEKIKIEYDEFIYLRNILNDRNSSTMRRSLNSLRKEREKLLMRVFNDTSILYYPKWIVNESIRQNELLKTPYNR